MPAISWRRIGSSVAPRARQGLDAVEVEALVGHEAVDAAALVLHLAHELAEAAVELADHVGGRDADVVEVDLAEVLVVGHVADGDDADAGRGHVDDELGQALVLGRVGVGAGDEVAPLGLRRRPRSRSSGR